MPLVSGVPAQAAGTPPSSPAGRPAQPAQPPGKPPAPSEAELRAAVEAANRAARASRVGLEFSMDKETGKILVQVRDGATNEVIRQIPSEEMISIAHAIDHMQGLLLKQKA